MDNVENDAIIIYGDSKNIYPVRVDNKCTTGDGKRKGGETTVVRGVQVYGEKLKIRKYGGKKKWEWHHLY